MARRKASADKNGHAKPSIRAALEALPKTNTKADDAKALKAAGLKFTPGTLNTYRQKLGRAKQRKTTALKAGRVKHRGGRLSPLSAATVAKYSAAQQAPLKGSNAAETAFLRHVYEVGAARCAELIAQAGK